MQSQQLPLGSHIARSTRDTDIDFRARHKARNTVVAYSTYQPNTLAEAKSPNQCEAVGVH
jgi:hypothetical protein